MDKIYYCIGAVEGQLIYEVHYVPFKIISKNELGK